MRDHCMKLWRWSPSCNGENPRCSRCLYHRLSEEETHRHGVELAQERSFCIKGIGGGIVELLKPFGKQIIQSHVPDAGHGALEFGVSPVGIWFCVSAIILCYSPILLFLGWGYSSVSLYIKICDLILFFRSSQLKKLLEVSDETCTLDFSIMLKILKTIENFEVDLCFLHYETAMNLWRQNVEILLLKLIFFGIQLTKAVAAMFIVIIDFIISRTDLETSLYTCVLGLIYIKLIDVRRLHLN